MFCSFCPGFRLVGFACCLLLHHPEGSEMSQKVNSQIEAHFSGSLLRVGKSLGEAVGIG